MELFDYIALLTGFGGVILGGVITFITERRMRNLDRLDSDRAYFVSVGWAINSAYADMVTVFKSMISTIDDIEYATNFVHFRIRDFVDIGFEGLKLDPKELSSVSYEDNEAGELAGYIDLYIKRYNSVMRQLSVLNELRKASRADVNRKIVSFNNGDSAEVEMKLTREGMVEMVRLENAYRETLKLIMQNIAFAERIIPRYNAVGKQRYRKSNGKAPSLIIDQPFKRPAVVDFLKPLEMSSFSSAFGDHVAPYE